MEAQQQSLKNANTSFEWLMQSGELGDLCLLFNFDMAQQGWERLIFGGGGKLRASLFHFGHITHVGDQATQKDKGQFGSSNGCGEENW